MTALEYLVEELQKRSTDLTMWHNDILVKAEMMERNQLIDFFKFFRDNGENHIGLTIEQFVDLYLKSNVTPESL